MRRFKFALDGLLQLRRAEEQDAQRQLQRAQAHLQQAEATLQAVVAEHADAVATLRHLLNGNAPADEVLLAVRRLDAVARRRSAAERQVAEAQAEVERCLSHYRACRQRRELLEELRQRAWRQWLAEVLREQQGQADERALRDFAVAREAEREGQ